MDYVTLSSSPYEEDCVQVKTGTDYLPKMREEVRRYVDMLRVRFPFAESMIKMKSFGHDFGTYCEAILSYNEESEEEVIICLFVEDHTPARWSDNEVFTYEDAERYYKERREEDYND